VTFQTIPSNHLQLLVQPRSGAGRQCENLPNPPKPTSRKRNPTAGLAAIGAGRPHNRHAEAGRDRKTKPTKTWQRPQTYDTN